MLYAYLESLDQAGIRCVILGEFDSELKLHHDLVGLGLHDLGEAHEVLVDHEALLGVLNAHLAEALKDLGHKHVEDFVNLQEVLEKEVDHVREKAGALAKVLVLKDVEDLGDQGVEGLVNAKDLLNGNILDLRRNF